MRKLEYKGRAALNNRQTRFVCEQKEQIDDGWGTIEESLAPLQTVLSRDAAKTVITYNQSPDVGFDRSINPYRGCEHGCIYCFARPTHAYLNLSPGLDFETRLFYKPGAAALLRKELNARNYQPAPIALGINTDAYQPVEKRMLLTREILTVLSEFRHPVTIVTKSALIERDADILAEMAKDNLVNVVISLTTLDHRLARIMEPRACAPTRRLQVINHLQSAGIPVGVLVAPVIPVLTDHEMEAILEHSRGSGAGAAGYVLLRLPHELKQLFREWLGTHFPDKAQHVMNRIQDCREGQDYVAEFGSRMRGSGPFAELIRQRFNLACRKWNYGEGEPLSVEKFRKINDATEGQLELF
ncbi:MAG: PA0069 family radical SAM protein [Gammaproteobacteria bacterium]|nr:PA0069 family radical SAM protein [Gammaproteobacteria bacterium]